MKYLILLWFVISVVGTKAQETAFIKVHFWYGSKPGKGYKKSEPKYFGGLHGGHVTVEFGDTVIGFNPKKEARIFPKKSHSNGTFTLEHPLIFTFDSTDNRQSTIIIPVTQNEITELKKLAEKYLNKTPYDYALFGPRCAYAVHEFLSHAGVFKKRSKFISIFYNFYPKKLRKRLYDIAFEKGFEIIYQDGRPERKWEGDKIRHRKKLNQILIQNKS